MSNIYYHLFSFIFPVSITKTTSSIVMEVSAIFVAMTILVTPSGGRLKNCRNHFKHFFYQLV